MGQESYKTLKNFVSLITGGAQGVGWATALVLADAGSKVFICDISKNNLKQASLQLRGTLLENDIHLTYCDVSDFTAVEEWIKTIFQKEGHIDVVINNANFIQWGLANEIPIKAAERMMQVGYIGMLNVIKVALPIMQTLGRGHIINIGSAAGKLFVGGVPTAYAAMKAAIDGYTRSLQLELKQSSICISLIRLGIVMGTDFFRSDANAFKYMPRFADFIPHLTPPKVATAVLTVIKKRRKSIIDIPSYLKLFYFIFEMAPWFFLFIIRIGGHARCDYGKVKWKYTSRTGNVFRVN